MRAMRSDRVITYVNRAERRREETATSCSKFSTFMQMLLVTAGICLAMVVILHTRIF